jgi:hypothetical protein
MNPPFHVVTIQEQHLLDIQKAADAFMDKSMPNVSSAVWIQISSQN